MMRKNWFLFLILLASPLEVDNQGIPLSVSSECRDWCDEHCGQVRSSGRCFFNDASFQRMDGEKEDCSTMCLENERCNHFYWLEDTCYLKKSPVSNTSQLMDEILPEAKDSICGVVLNRTGAVISGVRATSKPKKIAATTTKKPVIDHRILVWSEEFDHLDTNRWRHSTSGWNGPGSQNQFQFFTNRSENTFIRNGVLFIKPTLTSYRFGEGFLSKGTLNLLPEGCNPMVDSIIDCKIASGEDIFNPIQSAWITSEGNFSTTYGSVEIRAKMPKGDWIRSSIWMLPTESKYGDYPRSGKIDIADVRGNADYSCGNVPLGRQLAGCGLHWGPDLDHNGLGKTVFSKINQVEDFSSSFHVYRVDRLFGGMRFFIDGQLVGHVNPPNNGGFWKMGGFAEELEENVWDSPSKVAPFDQPFHFALGVTVGGTAFPDGCSTGLSNTTKPWKRTDRDPMRKFWAKKGQWLPTWGSNTTGEDALQVDYIRVYMTY